MGDDAIILLIGGAAAYCFYLQNVETPFARLLVIFMICLLVHFCFLKFARTMRNKSEYNNNNIIMKPLLTIVITSSPIPSHPSIEVIKDTIDSLSYLTLPPNTPVILTHDFGESESYDQYLKTLGSYIQDKPNVKIVKKPSPRGYLTGNLKYAMDFVHTKYILKLEHDTPFIAPVNMIHVIEDMIHRPELKHVRFNIRHNVKIGSDALNDLFGNQLDAIHQTYTRTPSWSDQNHITTTDYYRNIVFVEGHPQFPERNLIKRSVNQSIHNKYGTYLYGPLNYPARTKHMDGRNYKRNL